jgi:proteasome lid subunit RPN8/RPN11
VIRGLPPPRWDADDLFGAPSLVEERPRWAFLQSPRWTQLELPARTVFVRRAGLARMFRQARRYAARAPVEVGFLCLGRRERDAHGAYTVLSALPLVGVGTRSQVVMPAEEKLRAQRQHPELDVVGWAHTHPGFGVFFSGTDDENCAHYGPDAVNLVYDPLREELGLALGPRMVRVVRGRELHSLHLAHGAPRAARPRRRRGMSRRVGDLLWELFGVGGSDEKPRVLELPPSSDAPELTWGPLCQIDDPRPVSPIDAVRVDFLRAGDGVPDGRGERAGDNIEDPSDPDRTPDSNAGA